MTILEERGLFWWDTGPLPDNILAPEERVAGVLKIEEDGRATLELDGWFPSQQGPAGVINQKPLPSDRRIQGRLRDSNKSVLLMKLQRDGGRFSTGGISFERFVASCCLVSNSGPLRDRALTFNQVEIPLEGLEEWLRLGGLKSSRGKRGVTVKYKRSPKKRYRLNDGTLSFDYALDGKMGGAFLGTSATMRVTASATRRFDKPQSIETIQTEHRLFEDLLLLLTGVVFALPWPEVRATKTESHSLYFWRALYDAKDEPPKYYDCVANYIQLREDLGAIWTAWKGIREELGPGVYLFLGASKRAQLYVEHRFVNLVWGLEAFHRRRQTLPKNTPIRTKIDRILGQVAKKDRRWLASRLENADEPALSERLYQTLRSVPLNLEDNRLRTFATDCARLRNDISHFGESRQARTYGEFINDTNSKAEALSTIYHMLLLQELGVNQSILKAWVYEGQKSFGIKYHFVQAGLLDEDALKPARGGSVVPNA
jgi:ApeA N-terminal domain 1